MDFFSLKKKQFRIIKVNIVATALAYPIKSPLYRLHSPNHRKAIARKDPTIATVFNRSRILQGITTCYYEDM